MATTTRANLIAEAIVMAGRKGQPVPLTTQFDFILKDMSRRYPILRNVCHPFTTVASQSWVALPTDYRSWEQCFYDDDELDWFEPEIYFNWIRTETDTAATPSKFTIAKDENRIYLWPKPSAATASYLYYAAIHPKVEKTLVFTSGGTYQVKVGDTVTGATSTKTMVVNFVRVTSGSWAGENAAGYLVGTPSGAFQSENLNVGTNLNVATIAADATTTDNFLHFFGEEFDEVIFQGLLWRAYKIISGTDPSVKKMVKEERQEYLDLLADYGGLKTRRKVRTSYVGY